MSSLRRWAPAGALAVLAGAWSTINVRAFDASVRHAVAVNDLLYAYLVKRDLALGHVPPPQVDPSTFPHGWSIEWLLLGPELLLLVGASLLAVLLRRSLRGPWWLGAVVAPAFSAGYSSLKDCYLYGAAGLGTTNYATATSQFHAQGLTVPNFAGPSWLIPATAVLAVLVVLVPALCTRRRDDAVTVTRAWLVPAATVGIAATLGMLALNGLTNSSGPEVPWRGPVGAAPLVFALALVFHARLARAVPALIAGAAAIVAGVTGASFAQIGIAVLWSVAAVAVASVAVLPWSTARDRLNARWLAGTVTHEPS